MNKVRLRIVFMSLCCIMAPAFCGVIYKKTTPTTIYFSDEPSVGAIKIKVESPKEASISEDNQVLPSSEVKTTPSSKEKPKTEGKKNTTSSPETKPPHVNYSTLTIQYENPENKQYTPLKNPTSLINQYNLKLKLIAKPNLQKDDTFVLLLDNKPHGEPQTSPVFSLGKLPQNKYSVSANILDREGKHIAKSDTFTVYIRYVLKRKNT